MKLKAQRVKVKSHHRFQFLPKLMVQKSESQAFGILNWEKQNKIKKKEQKVNNSVNLQSLTHSKTKAMTYLRASFAHAILQTQQCYGSHNSRHQSVLQALMSTPYPFWKMTFELMQMEQQHLTLMATITCRHHLCFIIRSNLHCQLEKPKFDFNGATDYINSCYAP